MRPIGFGRSGERVAKTPCGRLSKGGRADQLDSLGAVEHPDDEEVREAFDVSQSTLKFRLNLEHALGFVLRAQAFGNLLRARVRASHVSNRLWREHLAASRPETLQQALELAPFRLPILGYGSRAAITSAVLTILAKSSLRFDSVMA